MLLRGNSFVTQMKLFKIQKMGTTNNKRENIKTGGNKYDDEIEEKESGTWYTHFNRWCSTSGCCI